MWNPRNECRSDGLTDFGVGFRERYSEYGDGYDGMFLPTRHLIYLG
jgi:hypothetical protein